MNGCGNTGNVDLHALEDFSASFLRKPIPKTIREVLQDTLQTPLNMEGYEPTLFETVTRDMVQRGIDDDDGLRKFVTEMQKKHRNVFHLPLLLYTLRDLKRRGEFGSLTNADMQRWQRLLCTHAQRSESGVMVIAVFTSPYPKSGEKIAKFSCPYDCHYCKPMSVLLMLLRNRS